MAQGNPTGWSRRTGSRGTGLKLVAHDSWGRSGLLHVALRMGARLRVLGGSDEAVQRRIAMKRNWRSADVGCRPRCVVGHTGLAGLYRRRRPQCLR
eukprot:scaffold2246_cov215-Pinguiococcus_pyrenoidosus.AAC.1